MKRFYLLFPFLIPAIISNAQVTPTSVWKWISGDSTLDSHGRYGTKGVANSANSPYSRNGGRSWTDASGNFWLFGGLGPVTSGNNKLNDLWRYVPSAGQWTWISGDSTPGKPGIYGTKGVAASGNLPGGRTRSVNWMDGSGNLWIYGGQGSANAPGTGLRYLSDLWKYNPTSDQWTWVSGDSSTDVVARYGTKGVASTGNSPGARNNASSWKDGAGNFWLFGGFGFGSTNTGVGQLNDLWKYNPATSEWTWISGDTIQYQGSIYGTSGVPAAANHPGARELTVNWTDAGGRFWMFGGTGYNSAGGTWFLNELWKYDPSAGQWTWMRGDSTGNQYGVYGVRGVAAAGNMPGSRQGGPGWVDGAGDLWLSGGLGYSTGGPSGRLSDIWKYSPSTNMWTWVNGDSMLSRSSAYGIPGVADTAYTPGGRSGHVAWIDGAGDLYLFGGVGLKGVVTGFENDLWKLVPSTPGVGVYSQVMQDVMLYPNPAKDGLYLTWKVPGNIQWQIFDNTGKLVNVAGWNVHSSNSLFINISSLPAGIYHLQVTEGLERKQFQFLKL